MSGDYTYDDETITLGSSKDENTATGLAGYDGDISPAQSWPGRDANPQETVADVEEMREVAKKLRGLADEIREHASVRDVPRYAGEVQLGPQSWQGANYLKQAGVSAAGLVSGGAKQIAANLDLAAQAIETAANGYDNAEGSNTAGFNQ